MAHDELQKKFQQQEKQYYLTQKANNEIKRSAEATALSGHGIKSPLTRIVTLSELLLKEIPGDLNSEQKEYVQDIFNNSFLLLNAINSLLSTTRGESGYQKLHLEMFNLKDIIESVVARIDSIAASKGTIFIVEVSDDLPLVHCDRYKIEQVLYNLLDNAMKFTSDGTITISANELPDNSIKVAVADTGLGIKEKHVHKVFDKFFTLKTTVNPGGSGLGLSVVQEIIKLHNGKVFLESQEGVGTTVTFIIPNSSKSC